MLKPNSEPVTGRQRRPLVLSGLGFVALAVWLLIPGYKPEYAVGIGMVPASIAIYVFYDRGTYQLFWWYVPAVVGAVLFVCLGMTVS